MSLGDKFENKAENLGGKAKEAAGTATGDEQLRSEGKFDQVKAGLKDAGERVKDAAEDVADAAKRAFNR